MIEIRKRSEAAAALLGRQRSGALQQARVQIENVARVCLSSGCPAQQQRQFAVGLRVLAEIVEDDQRVVTVSHPVLRECTARKRGEILDPWQATCLGDDHRRVRERLFLGQ